LFYLTYFFVFWANLLTKYPIFKLKKYAFVAPEGKVLRDGAYKFGLIKKANVVSDEADSQLCPHFKGKHNE
jgi:hypothetical protein